MARGGKGRKISGGNDGVVYESGPSESSGGIGLFNIFIFFLATTSIAINVGIIYGAIPIQGIIHLSHNSHFRENRQGKRCTHRNVMHF